MRFSKVLVTGGAGFIGSCLVGRLVAEGCNVTVLDNFSSGGMKNLGAVMGSGRVRVVRGDVRDRLCLAGAMRGCDAVVQLAALIDVEESVRNPVGTFDVNVGGTVNVLDEAVRADVGRFVFVSSAAVYGDGNPLPLREDAELKPLSPYAASKVSGEFCCAVFGKCYGLDVVVLRPFNVYGPGIVDDCYSGVIAKFLGGAGRGEPLVVFGDGLQTRDFVFVEDVVSAVVQGLEADGVQGGVFNVCSGVPVSVNDLVRVVRDAVDLELRVAHVEARKGDLRHSYGDPELAEKRLGFKAEVGLRKGLTRTFRENV